LQFYFHFNRLDQTEDRISGLEDKADELEHSDNNKEKIGKYEQNIQDHWSIIKRPKL
jgi:hypothetical protein